MKIAMSASQQRRHETDREQNTTQTSHGLTRKAGSGPATGSLQFRLFAPG
jgi:hypothetical protein